MTEPESSAQRPHHPVKRVHVELPARAHPVTSRQRDLDPTVRCRVQRRGRLRHHLHRQKGQRTAAILRRLIARIAAPLEDQVRVDVLAASRLGHRDTRRPSLRHDPALLVLRPEPAYTTRHNKASSDGVHQPMVNTIERQTDTIRNCRFAQTRHKAGHAGRLTTRR